MDLAHHPSKVIKGMFRMSYVFEIELIEMDLFEIELFQLGLFKYRLFGTFDSIRKRKLVMLEKLYGQSCLIVQVVHAKFVLKYK